MSFVKVFGKIKLYAYGIMNSTYLLFQDMRCYWNSVESFQYGNAILDLCKAMINDYGSFSLLIWTCEATKVTHLFLVPLFKLNPCTCMNVTQTWIRTSYIWLKYLSKNMRSRRLLPGSKNFGVKSGCMEKHFQNWKKVINFDTLTISF